jgi:predicted transcriptional regulator of viral defense system
MFVTRKRLSDVPTRSFNTPRGGILVSTPEATAIDLAGYPQLAGGLDHVATVLSELVEEMNPELLTAAAVSAPLPWVQRLGYLLQCTDAVDTAKVLKEYVIARVREYTPLLPSASIENAVRAKEWKVLVNTTVEQHSTSCI